MIRGKAVTIRTISEKDIFDLHRANSEIENHGMFNNRLLYSESQYFQEFKDTGFWNMELGGWLLGERSDDQKPVIQIGVRLISAQVYSLHYHLLDRKLSGKGYATEAVTLLCDYMFGVRPNQRLQANVALGNLASQRVLEKNGFILEGQMRQAFFTEGSWRDFLIYGLTRSDWEKLK